MNIMAARNKGNLNTSTNALLDSQNNHHHRYHPYRVHFTPQLELQDHRQYDASTHDQMAFPHVMNHSTPSSSIINTVSTDFKREYGGMPYDHLANFDQAFLYLPEVPASAVDPSASTVVQDQYRRMRPPTLNIFPAEQMLTRHPSSTSTTKASTTTILSPSSNGFQRPSELSNDVDIISNPKTDAPHPLASRCSKAVKRDVNKKGHSSSSEQDHANTPDPKTLRRLAQNREAARKSRLRKKAYVQQLESSRIKLNQLEQELQKFRDQGVFFGGGGGVIGADHHGLPRGIGDISSEAAAFNMEYARWLEEDRCRMNRLRAAVDEHLPEDEIRINVDNCITHFDDLVHLKSMMVKADVFYIISGMWKTPAEQCFLWIGGFRPSDLIKMIPSQIEPLTDQQKVGIFGLQNLLLEAEEGLSQELKQLNQSLSEAIVSENLKSPKKMTSYMGQMAAAMNKLSKLEEIVNQADRLRLQAILRVHQLMTTRQASRSLMAISEYFHRLRSLSSLWAARKQNP